MISVVVPVYCGAKSLPELVRRIDHVMNRAFKGSIYEIILVDDNSPDKSFEVIRSLSGENGNVLGIRLARNFGQQNATYCGLHFASGDRIVTMDDDLQHEPELLPTLIGKLSETKDLVYGVFVKRQDGEYRRMGSKLTGGFFRSRYGVLKGNRVSSFRVMTGELKDKILGSENGFVYLSCLLLEKCKGVENVRIPFTPRAEGRSNYSPVKLIKLYLKLQLNYGLLGNIYREKLKPKRPCFEVAETVRGITADGLQTGGMNRRVNDDEGHDAGWGNQSAMCN